MASRRRGAVVSLIGLDVGSTHVKAALVVPGRGVTHVARRVTVTHLTRGGGAFHKPEELLGAAESAIAECVVAADVAGADVPDAIGVASMAEAGVPLDARSRTVGEIVAWFDPRPGPQADWLERQVGAPALFARTGLRPEAKYTLSKLLWLRAERPSEFARLRRWAGVAELVAHRLTGELATNASLACRTAAFNVAERRWDDELLALAGLEAAQMPQVLPLGRAVGGLGSAAAARVGLRAGTPVAIAGHDHLVGAIGAGVTQPGQALDSMGSAEVALLVTRQPILTEEARLAGFSTGCHAVDGMACVMGGLQASGAMVEWFVDRFLSPASDGRSSYRGSVGRDDAERDDGHDPDRDGHGTDRDSRYARFLDLLDRVAPDPAEPLVRPYLRGRTAPHHDLTASLEIAGLRESHGLPDLTAALVDGAAFHVRWMFEELGRVAGMAPERVRLIGGGTRNPRWLMAKAALGPGRMELVRTDEAVALGAALVAGVATDTYESVPEALADAAPADRVRVSAGLRSRYDSAYRDRWLPGVLATLRD
jgi:xylulokinase